MKSQKLKSDIESAFVHMSRNETRWVLREEASKEVRRLMKLKSFKAKFRQLVKGELLRLLGD